MENRDPYFDVVKFAAIFLVVFGHVQTAMNLSWGAPYIKNFVIGLNMPLFFFISGYFSLDIVRDGRKRDVLLRILGYLWPALLISCGFGLIKFVSLSAQMSAADFLKWTLGQFASFWFLWCLSASLLFTMFISRMSKSRMGILIWFCVFYLFLMSLPGSTWCVDRVRHMWPYFLLGLFSARSRKIWELNWVGFLCCLSFLCIVIFEGNVQTNGMGFYWVDWSIAGIRSSMSEIPFAIARWFCGVFGLIGLMWILHLLCKRIGLAGKRLASLGTTTLGVYILHPTMIGFLRSYMAGSICAALCYTFLLFGFCHCGIVVSRKIPFLNWLIWDFHKTFMKASNQRK